MKGANLYKDYYQGKKVLITGNTGFKGSWLSLYLLHLDAKVYGISNENYPNDIIFKGCGIGNEITQFYIDIRDFSSLSACIQNIQPDIIFHLAAQSLTYAAYQHPLQTFQVNSIGTANLLESLRVYPTTCDVIVITSDKCYKNNEWVWGYRENDVLAGVDPYSASKSIAEIIFNSYYQTFFKESEKVNIVSCRAGNVIGGGDWNAKRIIPDCIRAWKNKKPIEIRTPNAIRPWNDVLDVIYGYTLCASEIRAKKLSGESFNFGPQTNKELTVLDLVDGIWKKWGRDDFKPYIIHESKEFDENVFLKLNVDKAKHILKWQSITNVNDMLGRAAHWYWEYIHHPESIQELTNQYIEDYLSKI
ncbi:MAG: CDP-glucose 4,6-dehydratase [Chitinophagales bacterium]|nr:CDP-glucose 4,6-dehydratase [Chitinophagales bacterium]